MKDEGYQAVALELGKSYEALQRENAELKARLAEAEARASSHLHAAQRAADRHEQAEARLAEAEAVKRLRITDDRIFTVDGPHVLLFNPESGLNEVIATGEAADALANAIRRAEEAEARLREAERQISRLFDAANHAKNDCVSAECYVCALEGRLAEAEARADITEREFCSEQTEHAREILRHGITKHRAETALARVTELEAESVRQYNHIARLESMYKLGVSPSEPESEFWHEWRIRAEKAEVARRELEGGTGREEGGG